MRRRWTVVGGLAFLAGALGAAVFFGPVYGHLMPRGGGAGTALTASFPAGLAATERAAVRARQALERHDMDAAVGAIADVRANLHDAQAVAPVDRQPTLSALDARAVLLATQVRDRRPDALGLARQLERSLGGMLAHTPGALMAAQAPEPTRRPAVPPVQPAPAVVPPPVAAVPQASLPEEKGPGADPSPRRVEAQPRAGARHAAWLGAVALPPRVPPAVPRLHRPRADARRDPPADRRWAAGHTETTRPPEAAAPKLPRRPVPPAPERTHAGSLPLARAEGSAIAARRAIADQNWIRARDQLEVTRVELAQVLPGLGPRDRRRIELLGVQAHRLQARLGQAEAGPLTAQLAADIAAVQQASLGGGGGNSPR